MQSAFNSEAIYKSLAKLRIHQQIGFGAMCCERMLPNYLVFVAEVEWGNFEPLRRGVDIAWSACQSQSPSAQELKSLVSLCEQCAPDSDDRTALYTACAQDAAFSVCALLDFLVSHDVSHLVTVAQHSIDSIDLVVQEQEAIAPQDSGLEQKILEHPLMQQELARQKRDLARMANVSLGDIGALLKLRVRVQQECNLLGGTTS